ncbi:hypothetical protein RRG08_010823 [Elysia crispata]|uniref:Uncharacterized protein n=1 Tax=Elysia crispata TaxID=231223 RepID=A0AAE0ZF34_9GAST|nr:hypothetical protein RRG08_010823 [Elysia crispata]
MPMSVKQSQPDKLFSGKVKISQQYGKSMLTRVKQYDNSVSDKAIQQHKKSFSDMANIVQPGKSSSDVANAKQQPGKWMLKMANTAQEPDQSKSSSNMTCCSTSNLTKKGQKSNKSTPAKTNISQQPDNLILSNKPILYEITDAAQSAKLILE